MIQKHIDEFTKEDLIYAIINLKGQLSVKLSELYDIKEEVLKDPKRSEENKGDALVHYATQTGLISQILQNLLFFYVDEEDKKFNKEIFYFSQEELDETVRFFNQVGITMQNKPLE